jgi:hypothetical protein
MAEITKLDNTGADEKAIAEKSIGSDAAILEEQPDGVYTHRFSKPVLYDGKTYESLSFDFDRLTGGDSLDVMDELMRKGHGVFMKTSDDFYITKMCARACREPVGDDIFRLMPVKDHNTIINRSRRFF